MSRGGEPQSRPKGPGLELPSRLSALLREIAEAPAPRPEETVDAPLRPGTVVGKFELVREIGRGGFGVVYEARDRELGRGVAVKFIRTGQHLELREERLLREAEAAAGLSHPNIVTLFDLGRSEHGPYLVLELLAGQTLAERLERGPVPAQEAVRIVVEVAKGLAHVHSKGIFHRDLKPSNVFLCESGQVKVLDLGLAHAFGQRRQEGGTPGYMALEQQRQAPEDERTDVYALGVILFRLLANDLPFHEPRGKGAEPAPTLDTPSSPALGKLVSRMLDHDPVRRPRDAGEVVAALVAIQREMEQTPSASARVIPPRSFLRRRRGILAVAGLVVLVGAAALGWARHRRGEPAPALAPSIAVLPFVDVSPQRDQSYFSDGLADEILNALAQVEGLRIPGRTSSFHFKGTQAKLADIGRDLKVEAVLEGSVRMSGNRVRVTAQVVNVADGYRQWSETYDRELTDIFAVQEEIAQAVVRALGVRLLGAKVPDLRARSTGSTDAYVQYLTGRQQYHRFTRQGFQAAVEAYERALALDPGYAPAWAGLAMPLFYLAGWGSSAESARAMRERAMAAAERAVALSPDLPDALSTRGFLRSSIRHDVAGATADLRKALQLNGNDPDTRRRHAVMLWQAGRLPEAQAEARRSVELDPLGQAWILLGTLLQSSGDLEQADVAFRRHLKFAPDTLPGLVGLGRNQLLQGRAAEALATFERTSDEQYQLWGRAAAEHSLGNGAVSKVALDTLVARLGQAHPLAVAELHAWRGDTDAALGYLEQAVARRDGSFSGEIAYDPFLRSARGDPRFQALLRELNPPAPTTEPTPGR